LARAAKAYYFTEFRQAVPNARTVELDSSNHTTFAAKEDETVDRILDSLRR
jgi:hypothetical protein